MLKITLLQTNGSRKGTRTIVDSSPYVIGRSENCHLAMASRTVSRKHCVIIYNDFDVLIRDLGSRNGSIVDGETVSDDDPRQLSHHSTIRIGKYTFRISIRDAETKEPHHPVVVDLSSLSEPSVVPPAGMKGTAKLLNELDELAESLEYHRASTRDRVKESCQSMRVSTVEDDEHSSRVEPDDAAAKSSSDGDSQKSKSEGPGSESTVSLGNVDEEESDVDAGGPSQSDDAKDPKAPMKIPEHLRPKGAKDSKDAAVDALRNLFIRE